MLEGNRGDHETATFEKSIFKLEIETGFFVTTIKK